ncbi:amino acid adenylation domain-containing protein [Streptomyces iconiensis]|uniref:Amino acid adenylation domain-containing protein n=1 Tax=Streptomyces iconiensis TaxID=1384038 RepID=A0ABT6ZZC1_9ACTN|nr:non-ribosomal peptide synthetase [Streptomyces iconiensis]MDJ1134419.1 amino acid adenylation domain-containing protein [Streptomyces iconiensis]
MHQRQPRPARTGFPLLTSQAGIHYAQQLAPASAAFQTADRVEITGPLDTDLFVRALRQAVEEADTLRLRVCAEDEDEPSQEVVPLGPEWRPEVLDLRAADDPDAGAEAWMRADLAVPADLSYAPALMTQALIRVADDRHWWYQRVHHVAVDAYALRLVGTRVAELYTALATGQAPPERQFAGLRELVAEERAYLDSDQYTADRAFWAERMAGHTTPATLAERAGADGDEAGRTGSGGGATAGDALLRRAVTLPAATFERFTRAAASVKATWAELVLAATAGYLHRHTGAPEVVLGLPVTNRRGPAALRTPAMTVNVLPLRLTVSPYDTGAALLRRVVLEVRAVRRHQRYPQAALRRDLALGAAGSPLTGPMVNIKAFEDGLDLGGLPCTLHNLAAGPVEDLAFGAAPTAEGGLRLTLDGNAHRYDDAALARHERHLLRYLDGLAALLLHDPQSPVGTLDLLSPAEVAAATTGRTEPDVQLTLPEVFAARAARSPDEVAVRARGTALTFAGLDASANQLAHHLVGLGVGPERPVALALPRRAEMVVALLAVLKAGGVCQPLDLGHPAARTRAVLDDAAPVCVLGTGASLGALPPHGATAVAVDDPDTVISLAALPTVAPPRRPAPRDAAYLIHTSGSTGRPKGVVVTHASLANLLAGHGEDHVAPAAARVAARTGRRRMRVAHSASFAFDASWDPLLWMCHGHELHLLDETTYRDPALLAAYVDEERVDYLDVTPSYAEALVAEGLLEDTRHRPAVVVVGGEAVSAPLWERLTSTDGVHAIDLYGPTETTVDAFYSLASGGGPVRGSRVYVLDTALRPTPPGVPGELYVAGPCLARGYLGRPDLTAERFVADPYGPPGSRMYRTGDLVRRRADSSLEFLGRADDQLKIRGFRVELGEIQATLAAHPDVAEAAVIARDGRHGKRVLAYAVLATDHVSGTRDGATGRTPAHPLDSDPADAGDGTAGYESGGRPPSRREEGAGHASRSSPSRRHEGDGDTSPHPLTPTTGHARNGTADHQSADNSPSRREEGAGRASGRSPGVQGGVGAGLRAYLAGVLAGHMVPEAVVVVGELPRTVHGKLDAGALPEPEGPGGGSAVGVAVADPLVGIVCGMFAEVLGLEDEPSADAGFFELGGHSLLAGRLAARVRGQLGVAAGIADVFRHPSPRALAAFVRGGEGDRAAAIVPLGRAAGGTTLPLSSAQQRLWFLDRLEGPSATYNIPLVLTLEGALDEGALEAALADLCARHETLRTVYPAGDGEPCQLVLAADDERARPVLHVAGPGTGLAEAVRHTFDLAAEPPLRVTLFRGEGPDGTATATDTGTGAGAGTATGAGTGTGTGMREGPGQEPHTLLVLLHHIAGDGASTTPLTRDLATAYAARAAGRVPEFEALPVQYADHAAWQREALGTPSAPTPRAKELLAYWKHALAGLPDELELPVDRPRPAVASAAGDTVPFTLGAEAHRALRRLARGAGTSVFMAVQAGLAALLTRHGCGTDIPVGSPVAGRDVDGEQTAGLVGFFTNTVVLRTDTSGDPDFRTLLDRVRTTTLAAYEHDALPFDHLVEELNPRRSLARHPLFQTMLAWQSVPDTEFALAPGVRARMTAVPSGTAKFDLTLNAGELPGGGISGFLEFRTDLFDRATARALADRLARLLTAAAERPDIPLGLLPLLGAGEWRRVLVEDNQQEGAATSEPATLPERYEEAARRHPERTAVTCAGVSLTYAELSARARLLARRLAGRGIGPGDIVALALPRSPELVTGLLAVSLCGAAYLPLDPDYPADRLAYMLEDAAPAALVTDTATAPGLPPHTLPVIAVDARDGEETTDIGTGTGAGTGTDTGTGTGHAEGARTEEARPAGPLAQRERTRPLTPADPAYVIYTSGSTGRPKGVVVTHDNVTRLLTSTDHWFGFGEEDVWTLFHSYAFDFSVWELWGALLYGGKIVVVPHVTSRDPRAFLRLLVAEGVTVLNQTPSAFYQLAAADREEPGHQLALRYVVFGGEALELGRLADWYERHADDAPTLVNMYGITETTVHVSYLALDRATAAGSTSSAIGVNLPDLRVYVLDDRLQPVPPGVTGDMYVAGRGVARGYLGRPALTATRFVADPYAHLFGESGARMYRSGDLARRGADGTLDYFGRADQQVKLRGFRIELGEIEAVLAAHPSVADAAVVVREDVPGDRRLVGYAVPASARAPGGTPDPGAPGPGTGSGTPGGPLDPAELRAHAARELPSHMVPAALVPLDRLPLTSNGKLDRKALPAPERPASTGHGRAPRTPREARLCGIFGEVLGLPGGHEARVSPEDNFFELGGHSLLAVRLAARVEATFGREVSIGTVFSAPTPAALDAALEAERHEDPLDVLLPLRRAREGDRAPLFCVHPAGGLSWCYASLIRELPADVPLYGLQARGVGHATAGEPLPGTLEELAAHYAARLREVAPSGPYRLLGWSTGGIIAHAMAAHLQETGHEVELLAVLDAYPAEGFRELPEADEPEALESLLTMGGYGPDSLEGEPLTLDGVVAVLRREGSPLAALPRPTVEALRDIYLNTNHLVRGYDHRRFRGDVLFFRATVDTVDEALTPETWAPYVSGRIDNTDVACAHKDMTLPEPIARIARVVTDRLTELEDPKQPNRPK